LPEDIVIVWRQPIDCDDISGVWEGDGGGDGGGGGGGSIAMASYGYGF
jgi:hypothetical protein